MGTVDANPHPIPHPSSVPPRVKAFSGSIIKTKRTTFPLQVYVKSQTNFVSLLINSIIVSKKEFNSKTNCALAEKWQTTFSNTLILGFLFHKRAHIQYKNTWAVCSSSLVFLCDFTFNKKLRSLQYVKYFYFRLQLSLVFYYPKYIIVSTSLGSCMQTGHWIGSSFLYSQQLAQSVLLFVFPASCWKKIDVLILFFIFPSVLILTIISSTNFSQWFHEAFENSHRSIDQCWWTPLKEAGVCKRYLEFTPRKCPW